jgi:hypothetical protein
VGSPASRERGVTRAMQGFLLFLGFLIVLCIPSTNLQLFNGLPFSTLPEFAVLTLAVPFLIFPELRIRQADFWARRRIRPAHLWILLAAVLLLKAVLFTSGEHAGFSACYRSPAEPTSITHEELPYRECERSYENLSDRFSATRLDNAIWFGENAWNLVFLNTNRYDYFEWEPGNILRKRIPIMARWNGYPDVPPGEAVRVEYVGEGAIFWGGVRIPLPPSYDEPNVVDVDPPNVESRLDVEYLFDDGSRSGQDPESWGPQAAIWVGAIRDGKTVPLSARSPAAGWRIAALFADGLILIWIVSCIPAVWKSIRADLLMGMFLAFGMAVVYFLPLPVILSEIGIATLLAGVLLLHMTVRPLHPLSIYLLMFAAAFSILVVWSSGFGQVLLRSAGNDSLQYESQAFSILATGSLRGGESVFYFQPMYRYVRFLEHVIFGDANTFSFIPPLVLYWGGIVWLFDKTRRYSFPAWKRVILLAAMTCALFLGGAYVSDVIRAGLSEWPTWILLVGVLPMLLVEPAGIRTVAGFAGLALSVTIRVNQVPAALWMMAVSAFRIGRRTWRILAAAVFGAAVVGALPLFHNLFFGNALVLFTRGSTSTALLAVPPGEWLNFFKGDAASTAAVVEQLKAIFLLVRVPTTQLPMLAAMAVLLICWLIAFLHAIVRRSWREWPVLVIPLFFLAPHLFYNVTGYYPKYIFIAYLYMGVILPVAWMNAAEWKAGLVSASKG